MNSIIAIIVFMAVFWFILALHYLREDRRRQQNRRRLQQIVGVPNQATSDGPPSVVGPLPRWKALHAALSRMGLALPLDGLLDTAGLRLNAEHFVLICLAAGLLFLLPVLALAAHPLFGLVFFAAGAALPLLYVFHRRAVREEALVLQLPEAIDMIVRALRVGQSVDGALKDIAQDLPAPLGPEIRKIYDEIAMGLSFTAALQHFAQRFQRLPDVHIFCNAFIVQRETGGNLTRILEGLSQTVRERFQLKRQVKALTAEGRASAVILALLPVAFAVITWFANPGYIQTLFVHPTGRALLLVAVLLQAAGFLVMRVLSRIEV